MVIGPVRCQLEPYLSAGGCMECEVGRLFEDAGWDREAVTASGDRSAARTYGSLGLEALGGGADRDLSRSVSRFGSARERG